jgi:hypothetical protein
MPNIISRYASTTVETHRSRLVNLLFIQSHLLSIGGPLVSRAVLTALNPCNIQTAISPIIMNQSRPSHSIFGNILFPRTSCVMREQWNEHAHPL